MQGSLSRKFCSYPGGEFVLIARCVVQDDRSGETHHHVRIIGEGTLLEAAHNYYDELTQFIPAPEEEVVVNEDDKAQQYLDMPTAAVPRSKKLRGMLRDLWRIEGHSNTKQIYNAVANGEEGFSWWNTEFPDIPFTNLAVEHSENSVRIYKVVAAKLYHELTGHPPPGEEIVVPSERCDKFHPSTGRQDCALEKGHRGRCNMKYAAPSTEEEEDEKEEEEMVPPEPITAATTDPVEFYTYVRSVCHKLEPFLQFTSGQIKQFSVHYNDTRNRLLSYRMMGITVPRKYERWYAENHGAWADIAQKFPDYLEDHVLLPPNSLPPPPPPPPPPRTRVYNKKKRPSGKRVTSNRARKSHKDFLARLDAEDYVVL
jgi:muconolactone delta-isomerase